MESAHPHPFGAAGGLPRCCCTAAAAAATPTPRPRSKKEVTQPPHLHADPPPGYGNPGKPIFFGLVSRPSYYYCLRVRAVDALLALSVSLLYYSDSDAGPSSLFHVVGLLGQSQSAPAGLSNAPDTGTRTRLGCACFLFFLIKKRLGSVQRYSKFLLQTNKQTKGQQKKNTRRSSAGSSCFTHGRTPHSGWFVRVSDWLQRILLPTSSDLSGGLGRLHMLGRTRTRTGGRPVPSSVSCRAERTQRNRKSATPQQRPTGAAAAADGDGDRDRETTTTGHINSCACTVEFYFRPRFDSTRLLVPSRPSGG